MVKNMQNVLYARSTTVVSTEQVINTDKGDFLATKLDRLHDKNERYKSHKDFLVKCLEGNVIPKGLRLDLEPSIGNHDEEFLNKLYGKLEEFSKSFMNDVISFCDKTLTETEAKITDTDKYCNYDNIYTFFSNLGLKYVKLCNSGYNCAKNSIFTKMSDRTFLHQGRVVCLRKYSESYIDGVAVCSHLGPTLVNILLCYYEWKWLFQCPDNFKPVYYAIYIDEPTP